MDKNFELYEKGLETFSLFSVVLNNIIMILWIISGSVACTFISPIIGKIYLFTAVFMVYFVLRKIVCTNCYYYGKMCSTGWGILAEHLFRKGNINNFRNSIGNKLAPITYFSLLIVPLILVLISIIREFTTLKFITLILLLLTSIYSSLIGRKKSCRNCKMRLICPGCAIKIDIEN